MTTLKSFLESEYKLKTNPFMSRVDLQAPMAGRLDVKDRWTAIIERRKGATSNSLNFIVGDYGLGKSFTLYKIVDQIKADRNVLPLYMKFLPEDPISRFGLDFVQRIFVNLPPALFRRKIAESTINKLKKLDIPVAVVLDKFFQQDDLAQAYLKGERTLTANELKELGARRKFDRTSVAEDYLIGLLYILYTLKIVTIILAIDEVEYVFSQLQGARIATVFNTLRDFYDLPQSPKAIGFEERIANIIFFFGISQAGWRRLNELERREQRVGGPIQALLDRRADIIELSALDEAETKQLIELRLSYNRTTRTNAQRLLIPYTDDFVSYVFQMTQGNPRHIVERCDLVLEDGLREQVPLLNEAFARKVLASHGLPSE